MCAPVFRVRLANQDLLVWKIGTTITEHVANVQEYELQCEVLKIKHSKYMQWMHCIEHLPQNVKSAVENKSANLISDTFGTDKIDNIPYQLY